MLNAKKRRTSEEMRRYTHCMGNLISAPIAPTTFDAQMDAGNKCPDCGHNDLLAEPDYAGLRRLFRRPVVSTCSHIEITQDALVDDSERCKCEHGWHH